MSEKDKKELQSLGSQKADIRKNELEYWSKRKEVEKDLTKYNTHYEKYYTAHFNLDEKFYSNKKILDIGCGPRGSLEWANMVEERIGIDPLAFDYLKLGAYRHKMKYVSADSEKMPFADSYFDVVCCFNSLDHVNDLEKTINEIIRVVKTSGLFLLITDVNQNKISENSISYSFDIVKKFESKFVLLDEKHYERLTNGTYQSITENIKYDHSNNKQRYGVLSAKIKRK